MSPVEGERLEVAAPFHMEATVRMLQRRAEDLVDRWEDERWLRLHPTEDGPILAEVENRGTLDRPELVLRAVVGEPSPAVWKRLVGVTRGTLGLGVDPSGFEAEAIEVQGLRDLVIALRGMRPTRFVSLFESFGRVVPYQQLSLEAGLSLSNHLVEHFGESVEWRGTRYYAYPAAEAVAGTTVEKMRELGFSHAKGRALIEVAERIVSRELSLDELEALPTEDVYERLLELRGVGPWTAWLVLLRGLGRLDAFPSGDVGANRGLARLVGEPAEGFAADSFAERFGDQRGLLYFYTLGAYLLRQGLITPAPPLETETAGAGAPG
ncbi:DNA-3-methyladenine glycosylase family protein [Vulgatibacter incomptus]|uniref:DNA-3-methyladenine glycosylase II n=1 Tax=Vulgatibacter incomptus TaxID=1391653 RepID=A0A0K1PIB3_9BACT|nr:DNA-3-methyladenine glycosylase [Vulgatibacter incomptus]AKU93242.1 DNA-3-methyladenine glycosylase II [Vulgatibacter incomptus]